MTPDNWYIKREIEAKIKNSFNHGKVTVIYGARRTGKTTLIQHLLEKQDYFMLACDNERVRHTVVPDSLALSRLIGEKKWILFDEAQYLDNAGLVLKVLIDAYPKLNVIATGSSSFDLANKLSEPLTGRFIKHELFPLSELELKQHFSPLDFPLMRRECLVYGSYPEVVKLKGSADKIKYLYDLTESYLYKDILAFDLVRDSRKLKELLMALSYQIGQEVSLQELGNTVGLDGKTVERYLDLLEKIFVVFRLAPYSRNLRQTINRKFKIFFWDLGVRNCLINNFNDLNLRQDKGQLFENFVIAEKFKQNAAADVRHNYYFWRTYEGAEIDLIEDAAGKMTATEIKWAKKRKLPPKAWREAFPNAAWESVVFGI